LLCDRNLLNQRYQVYDRKGNVLKLT
jgi:hypothetical protein